MTVTGQAVLAVVGGLLAPVVSLMALTATTLTFLVVVKLGTAQRLLRSSAE